MSSKSCHHRQWRELTSSSQREYRISSLKWKPTTLSLPLLFWPMPDPDLDGPSGFDNYLFDRYLHTITRIFVVLGLFIIPILLPLNVIAGSGQLGGVRGLDILSFSNVSPLHTERYWAHLLLALGAILFVCLTLQREIQDYARLSKMLLATTLEDLHGRSSLLLVSDSKDPLPSKVIRTLFRDTAGGVCNMTANRDYSALRTKLREPESCVERLEAAVTRFIIRLNRRGLAGKVIEQRGKSEQGMPLWTSYHRQDRPSMRLATRPWLPPLPLLGPRVDAIDHLCKQLSQLDREITWAQRHPSWFPVTNSAVIHFNQTLSTPLPALALKLGLPPSWTLKHGTAPNDTIWENISTTWWQLGVRTAVVYGLVGALICGFALPVAAAGTLSQVRYLANVAPWMHWIDRLPAWLIAAIQGVLPQVIVALITALAPISLRFLGHAQGLYSRRLVENHIQIYYFTFLFVQMFLMVSISSGLATVVGELSGAVVSVPEVLARNLPKASNYFFSYIIIQTFTTIAYTLLQFSGIFKILILSPLLDRTARRKWVRRTCLDLQKWSTFIPVLTNIACIGTSLSSLLKADLTGA